MICAIFRVNFFTPDTIFICTKHIYIVFICTKHIQEGIKDSSMKTWALLLKGNFCKSIQLR